MSSKKHHSVLPTTLPGGCDDYYQISDDDVEESDNLPEGNLLDDSGLSNSGRGPYERAWTTDATRALIHIRGPLEENFSEGRQKRTALWIDVTRQLQKLGYRYSAAKVQKKWHNILITYNKNLNKKFLAGYVHWEFFEEMFKYLQGKKAQCDLYGDENDQYNATDQSILQPQIQMDTKSTDEFEDESSSSRGAKKVKYDYNADNPVELPLEISHANGMANDEIKRNINNYNITDNHHNGGCQPLRNSTITATIPTSDDSPEWWKDYFERKLAMEREKIDLQREMHKDLIHFNKMSLIQQEKIERIKIDAINNLTSTLQKFVEVKNKKI